MFVENRMVTIFKGKIGPLREEILATPLRGIEEHGIFQRVAHRRMSYKQLEEDQ